MAICDILVPVHDQHLFVNRLSVLYFKSVLPVQREKQKSKQELFGKEGI